MQQLFQGDCHLELFISECFFIMDVILSEFVARTSADPGLATDLLEAHEWNLHSALSAYYVMKGILPGEVPPSDAEIAAAHSRTHSVTPSEETNGRNVVTNGSNTGSRPPLKKLPAFDCEEPILDRKLTRGIYLVQPTIYSCVSG
ncbi:OTU domain-containing protein 7B [Trichonephila clavata]|uniref:OTU domain-containing protein 7B n=1 Tax=Trichonephila clavata TaxID=2740835 RepID=A0A8X6I1A9_TRICU|nr:OTU domain-containing protein 7B [Trichonephila clavata]